MDGLGWDFKVQENVAREKCITQPPLNIFFTTYCGSGFLLDSAELARKIDSISVPLVLRRCQGGGEIDVKISSAPPYSSKLCYGLSYEPGSSQSESLH